MIRANSNKEITKWLETHHSPEAIAFANDSSIGPLGYLIGMKYRVPSFRVILRFFSAQTLSSALKASIVQSVISTRPELIDSRMSFSKWGR